MGLSKVTINVTGAINRPALNLDGVSGIVFYNDNIADLSTFTASNRIIKFTNLTTIEAEGITSDSTNFKAEHYQLKEYFREGGQAIYVGIFAIPIGAYDYAEIDLMKAFSTGEIRQYIVYTPAEALADVEIAKINVKLAAYSVLKKDAIAILGADVSGTALAAMLDLRGLAAEYPYVSVVTGQDTENEGLSLSTATTQSTPNIGAYSGAISSAKVSENVLHKGKYNYTDGTAMVTPGFYFETDTMTSVKDINEADLDALAVKGHVFWTYESNLPGVFLSNDNNCTLTTNTFNSVHLMRVRGKVNREVDLQLSKLLGAPVLYDGNKMRSASIKTYYDATNLALQPLLSNDEISGYTIFIDPAQDVVTTSTVTIGIEIKPVGTSDNITANIAFVASL